jgi:hypothetical protein
MITPNSWCAGKGRKPTSAPSSPIAGWLGSFVRRCAAALPKNAARVVGAPSVVVARLIFVAPIGRYIAEPSLAATTCVAGTNKRRR